MSTIDTYKKIPKNVSTNDDLDFEFLLKTGIEYIESMGGGLWTDYNEHDPGITMLQMLSYAITDLGARMDLPIATLIASKDDIEMRNQFYRAEEILPTSAVTALDYRKLFIDIEGVHNCWILPYEKTLYVNCEDNELAYDEFPSSILKKTSTGLQGMNQLLVDFEENADETAVKAAIMSVYHKNRNLCEDLVAIEKITEQPISVCASIELVNSADQNKVQAQIIDAIQQYFASDIRRYSLKEMREKGYRMDEIFEGPLLENGFIDSEELEKSSIRSEVRLSDLINLIMSNENVRSISNISMQGCNMASGAGSDWLICIDANRKPVLAPTPDQMPPTEDCNLRTVFNYKKDVLPVICDPLLVEDELQTIKALRADQNALAMLNPYPVVPLGEVLEIGETTTIMNDFPETYGIGLYGLPSTVPESRRAQAKQLKGYLLFFDQILATYFAHLGKIKDLFAMNSGVAPTYFTQAIKDVKGFEELVKNYPTTDDDALYDELIDEPLEARIARRNDILDHLLSRFAEQFSQYAFILNEMYGSAADEILLQSKEQFLSEYVELSSRRGKGFNYKGTSWNTDNISGVEQRIARLSGIENYKRRDLIDLTIDWIQLNSNDKYEWSVVDDQGDVLLTGGSSFDDRCDAFESSLIAFQLFRAVDMGVVYTAFGSPVTDGQITENILIETNETDVFSYHIYDGNANLTDSAEFTTQDDLLEAIQLAYDYLNSPAGIETYPVAPIYPEEGIFLVENILMLPEEPVNSQDSFLPVCVDDCDDNCALDPYSFRVSVVLPGTTERFDNADYRNFMDKLIREEMPSHVIPRICWIDNCQLEEFQTRYKAFLEEKAQGSVSTATLEAFIQIYKTLHNVYPGGRLFDCESTDLTGKMILGRSNL